MGNMENKNISINTFHSKLSMVQIEFIKALVLPTVMDITPGSEFDTQYVQTKSDWWEYVRMGSTYFNVFNLDKYSNKLLKILSVKYTDSHMSPLAGNFINVKKIFRELDNISFESLYSWLEIKAKSDSSHGYFEIKAITRYLIRMGFPGFDIDNEEVLARIPVPKTANSFLRYQDTENTMPSHLKNLIVRRLVELSTVNELELLSDIELKNLSVLALSYAVGPRPMQFSIMTGNTIKLVAYNAHTKLMRYEISVPVAKQGRVSLESSKVALSQEIGLILGAYKSRFGIKDNDPLYPYVSKNDALNPLSQQLRRSLNDALLFIQSEDTKRFVKENRKDRPNYTLYDFRHNIGHSMAMLNASAEEIATVLGHTSLVAAQYYIMATPELSLLKYQALGENLVWKRMIGLLLTGYFVDKSNWNGRTVSGMLKGKLIKRIGGCERNQDKCHLQKIRSCYGCFYFRPFKNLSKHETVLTIITDELIDIVQVSNDSGDRNNPLIDTATQTKNEVEMVINRLKGGLL